jgi:GAF domain-containing protein
VATPRGARLPLGAEAALALAAGIAAFATASVAVIAVNATALVVLLIAVCVAVILAAFRYLSPGYAVPVALAVVLAFDWYYIAPTHPHSFPDAENLVDLLVLLSVGALVGVLAARAGRRAAVTELARSELADEQAALRRVATLVAQGVTASRLMAAVAEEAGTLLGVDGAWIEFYEGDEVVTAAEWSRPGKQPPTFDRVKVEDAPVAAAVRRSGRVVRVDDFESIQPSTVFADSPRVMSLVGAPITVESEQWGLMLAWSQDSPLRADAESHLTAFTELVATAIANSDARATVSRLADQQAALRRVATLVARGVSPERLLPAVCDELQQLLGVEEFDMARAEGDGTVTVIAFGGRDVGEFPVGSRLPVEGRNTVSLVVETGRPARIDDYSTATGPAGEIAKSAGVRGAVGCPIVIQGRLWGVAVAGTRGEEPLPADSEERIAEFTDLLATAIANAEARHEVATLADEQAALRRVATLVAEGVPSAEVFAAVARELGQLLGVDSTHLARYEPDGWVTSVGSWSPHGTNAPVGTHVPLDDTTVTGLVHETGRPARLDGYGQGSGVVAEIIEALGVRSSVGAPITVDGQPWGVMVASSNQPEPLPADTEARIAAFTELLGTAISNTESRAETRRLAEEQAALTRVATLVAEAVPPSDLFSGVAAEVGTLLGAELATLFRYEDERRVRMLSIWTADDVDLETPEIWRVEELGLTRSTAEDTWPARVDDWTQFSGPLAQFVRDVAGVTSSVSSPILVEGRLWGALAVHSTKDEPLPPDTEGRVGEFTELIATAISNVQAREDLAASRARIVAAADEERRRVVRDLHDGAQQRLIHTIVTLNLARSAIEEERDDAAGLVSEAAQRAEEATGELRELAHGIMPSVLTRGGLPAGVRALASRMPVPVDTDVSVDRLPAEIESTAYFVVSEALTNVAKHARAEQASVAAHLVDGLLRIQVVDDGVGGADPDGGGFLGLGDRLAVHDGTLRVESPGQGGTRVVVEIPLR